MRQEIIALVNLYPGIQVCALLLEVEIGAWLCGFLGSAVANYNSFVSGLRFALNIVHLTSKIAAIKNILIQKW